MATQRFYDGQPGPDIRRELNNFEAKVDGTVAAAQDASTAATAASAKAQQWADAAPGVAVEPGKYSAKHWADRAQTTVTGGLIYRGSHSAASGAYPATPSLGDYYKISAAGTLGGVDYSVGDSIIYNGTDWDKLDSTDAVTSVAGRVGEVVLTKGDVDLADVDNTSDANKPISTATQTALDTKVDKVAGKQLSTEDYTTAEKSKLSGIASGANNYSHPEGDGNQHVPATGTTNNGKVLKAGSAAGSAAWENVDYSEVTGLQAALDGKANTTHTHAVADVTGLQAALDGKEPTIAAGTATQYWRGDKTWGDFFTDVRAATLTGLSTATNAVITATDTVLSALGKLQKQVSDNLATLTSHTGNTSNPHGVTKVQVGLGNVDNTADSVKPVSAAQAAAIAERYGKNNVLGPVSQSAGVPTGAVIERGSNANGEYVRFADGTQICTRLISYGAATFDGTFGALFVRPSEPAAPYPAAFTALHAISFQVTGSGVQGCISASRGIIDLANWPVHLLLSTTNAAQSIQISAVAIGRWF